MTRVKICGTCTDADLEVGVRAGADALGFVAEYPDPVPWNLDRAQARRLVERVPPFVSTVLVTTGSVEEVMELADEVRPDVVQLHGEEPTSDVEAIASGLTPQGVQTLKAISIDDDDGFPELRAAVDGVESAGVDGIVLDAQAEGRQGGGTGRTVPWEQARQITADADVPVVLAGGLTPENVTEAVETVEPYGVDVISGVEGEDHTKDPDRVAAFVDAARSR